MKTFSDRRNKMYYAAPFFMVDLESEIRWHKTHLEKLKGHKADPHKFHKEYLLSSRHSNNPDIFKEHVIESIPFHERILSEHEARLKIIKSIMPIKDYRRLLRFCFSNNPIPEYFVFDMDTKEVFFVCQGLDYHKKKWMVLAKKKGITDVVVIR